MNWAENLLEPTVFFNLYTKFRKSLAQERFGIKISNHSIVYRI